MKTIFFIFLILLPMHRDMILFDFEDSEEIRKWWIVNDGVMGGISESQISAEKGIAVFEGKVSLENYGGFASTRCLPQQFDLEGYNAIQLLVKGDGQQYKFRLRTNDNFDGASYSLDFTSPDGKWEKITLPFKDFQAQFRGRTLPDYEALIPENIEQLGILIADKQEGDFRLEIDWVKAKH